MSLLELFCHVDDFCQTFLPPFQAHLLERGLRQRQRARQLSPSESMTILIRFQQSHYRDFKAFYHQAVVAQLHAEFPVLVSFSRFVEFIPSVLMPPGAARPRRVGFSVSKCISSSMSMVNYSKSP
jgi:hypothetical protein